MDHSHQWNIAIVFFKPEAVCMYILKFKYIKYLGFPKNSTWISDYMLTHFKLRVTWGTVYRMMLERWLSMLVQGIVVGFPHTLLCVPSYSWPLLYKSNTNWNCNMGYMITLFNGCSHFQAVKLKFCEVMRVVTEVGY